MRGVEWSDSEILRAQALREQGCTSKIIAEIISAEFKTRRTRNSVVGQLYRLRKESEQ